MFSLLWYTIISLASSVISSFDLNKTLFLGMNALVRLNNFSIQDSPAISTSSPMKHLFQVVDTIADLNLS